VHNFFSPCASGRGRPLSCRQNADANRNPAFHSDKIKIGDVVKTHVSSALLRCAKFCASKRAIKIIFWAMSRALALNALRRAPDGGAYTQN
jgi:hypothetical protein